LIKFTALTLAGALLALGTGARAEPPSCTESPKRVGACFTVHGRVTSCTAVPSVRIWIVGTQRVLGVEDATGNPGGDPLLPDTLQRTMLSGAPCTKAAFGDLTVCPLTPQHPGVMQRVCVVSAKKIVVHEDW
jgi:hypothetical protein